MRRSRSSLGWTSSHLDDEDFGLPHQTLALVPLEEGSDVLNVDLAVMSEDVVILAMAQEHTDEAVRVHVAG